MTSIAHYNILDPLGAGGIGEIFRARDMKVGRTVALKVVGPPVSEDPASLARLVEDATLAARLSHPNIASLWDVGEAVSETFDDIEALAIDCRFTDCRHRGEPRCAVKTAVENGRLSATRLESYLKLQDELGHLARQQDERAQLEQKRRSKIQGKALKAHLKSKSD